MCEKSLKYAAYAAKIYVIIGIGITHYSMSRIHLRLLEDHAKLNKYYDDPENLPQVIRSSGIIEATDLAKSYL